MNSYAVILQYFFKRHWLLLILLSLWLLVATILFSWVTTLTTVREGFVGFLKLLPPVIQAKIGRDLSMLMDPTGSLALSLVHPLLSLPLALWTMLVPLRHLASDQERGLLDMLLAKPVSRMTWLFSVITILVGGLIFLTMVVVSGYFLGKNIFIELSQLHLQVLIKIILMQSFWAFLIGSVTALFASIFGRFRMSLGLGLTFVLVMFLWELICRNVSLLKPFAIFSLWHWVEPRNLFLQVVSFSSSIILIGIVLTLLWFFVFYFFTRHDLGAK